MKKLLSILFATLLLAAPARAQNCEHCITKKVHDGDTLTVQCEESGLHRIRLRGIDAPELKQPFGPDSRNLLAAFVDTNPLLVAFTGKDFYGRDLAFVYAVSVEEDVQGTPRLIPVNFAMVLLGAAWAYMTDEKEFHVAQQLAQMAKRRIWDPELSTEEPEAPWLYRKRIKALHH